MYARKYGPRKKPKNVEEIISPQMKKFQNMLNEAHSQRKSADLHKRAQRISSFASNMLK